MNLQALATALATRTTARAARAARVSTPRAPSKASRFLADLLASAPEEGIELPLDATVRAWCDENRVSLTGQTPHASITSALYCAHRDGTLPHGVTLGKGRPARLVIASAQERADLADAAQADAQSR